MNEIEENLLSNIEALESKYTLLKDQIVKFTKSFEDEKIVNDKSKTKYSEEIKLLDNKIKNMLTEERQFNQNYIEESFKRMENKLSNIESDFKEDNKIINENIASINQVLEVNYIFFKSKNY